ncbi:putative O-methyltransferase YrrM [Streptoalloteichus tenebrarius]|uniref:O-methyltransferase YrrM n=2 Tax=Streptoalloteichus tenebrarius (strain ATCC 17920 / DSM 40477 / JCM 4838 / CBS 697.72 / NBRC 16177 / NCIMB 11028 / NRRL B-12390 / A12253. 1 / ISP 5477) TaxID=1933 RepID=A0ABT1I075_STRSD|nr:putative O-methyltransferase YrrM [Streptoalloteichus tenebrarius]BFF02955.1 class I SAM-dependent methyltransferase [Streptoalloteichus tenebrarius]
MGLSEPRVRAVLDEIAAEQARVDAVEQPKLLEEVRARTTPWTPEELVAACGSGYYAAPAAIGRLLYATVRAMRPTTVIEFGTAYGFSTIHIAAALRDNGFGRVITTELHGGKAEAAWRNIQRAGVSDHVGMLVGEASRTLTTVPGPVDLLYLDGWVDFYLDVLRTVEPKLRPGALVHADDTLKFADGARAYLDHVRDPANGYVSTAIADGQGLELSSYVGAP